MSNDIEGTFSSIYISSVWLREPIQILFSDHEEITAVLYENYKVQACLTFLYPTDSCIAS
jgi:hypothetical protein